MGVVESVYKYEDQLANQWDFKIYSLGTDNGLRFKVQDVTNPFLKFNVERKFSGETVIKTVEEVEPITITFRESPNAAVYDFFKTWMDKFYDQENRVFKVFHDLGSYHNALYDVELTFYKSAPLAISIPYVDVDLASPGFSFLGTNCKPIGLETISLDYQGNPVLFSVSLLPEKIKKFEY